MKRWNNLINVATVNAVGGGDEQVMQISSLIHQYSFNSKAHVDQLLNLLPKYYEHKASFDAHDPLAESSVGIVSISLSSTDHWIFDSGAINHTICRKEWLVDLKNLTSGKKTVTLATCYTTNVTHIRNCFVDGNLILNNVPRVKYFKYNLISFSQLC